nr:MAG TPA_asm: hypothetical protein [Caudoviricetes sp.]
MRSACSLSACSAASAGQPGITVIRPTLKRHVLTLQSSRPKPPTPSPPTSYRQ